MSGPVDVLADLQGVVRIAKAASLGVTGNKPRIERAEQILSDAERIGTISSAPASPSRDALQALPLCHVGAGDSSTDGVSA